MDSVVIELLNELEHELTQTKKGLFSDKSLVDADACLDIIDEIRESLPNEIERAQNIMKERRQILVDAEEEAKQCIATAQQTADQMVAEDEITRNAEIEAKQIIDSARQSAKELKLSAKNYAVDLLNELKSRMDETTQQISQDLEDFKK